MLEAAQCGSLGRELFAARHQSHDYIVYPGYPDKESGTYEPVCEMSFCGVAPRPDGQRGGVW